MVPFRDTPIRQKLMTMILVTSGVVLVLTCATFIGYELLTYRRAAIRQLTTLGEIVAANSTAALSFKNSDDAQETLHALKAEPHIVAACLYRDGRIFSRYPADAPAENFPAAPEADGLRFSGSDLLSFTPVIQAKGSERIGTLYLCSDLGETYARLRFYTGLGLFVVLLCSVVAYMLSRVLQSQISNPIRSLAETAAAISERRDYSVRASKHGEDEIGALTDAFNHMLAQIQEQNELLERRVRERTAELELANDELEAFCSSAAHDLRTPLRAISGFSELLLDSRTKLSPADTQRYIRMIRDGSSQMADLINALLSFSRLGRQELTREAVDLEQICYEVFEDLENERRDRDVELRVASLPLAQVDPQLLRVVFTNLLSNAIKYSRPREHALIEVGVTQIEGEPGPVYYVRDNGVGFDMRHTKKLFGVFQRLHHAHEFEGTGVGLATVRRVVDRHGGRIWAEAKPDQGATFYFTLPETRPTETAEEIIPESDSNPPV